MILIEKKSHLNCECYIGLTPGTVLYLQQIKSHETDADSFYSTKIENAFFTLRRV